MKAIGLCHLSRVLERGVQVNFMKSVESANHTSETSGQFPAFIFSTC